jgi:hypothetical protein
LKLENYKNTQFTENFQDLNPAKEKNIQETYTGVYKTAGNQANNVLKIDSTGTAVLETLKDDYRVVRFGSWVLNTQKELVVTITGEEGKGTYKTPEVFVFSYNTEKILVANTYDTDLYKLEDLSFVKLGEEETNKLKEQESKLNTQTEEENTK